MFIFSRLTLRRCMAAGAFSCSLGCLFSQAKAAAPTVIHSFAPVNAQNVNADGDYPSNGVTQGSDGDWYGTTVGGGPAGAGTLFKMHPDGSGFTVLKTFNGSNQNTDGGYPGSPLTLGIDGYLYGTTSNGGANGDGNSSPGTIFRVSPTGQFQTLSSFPANDADPAHGGGQVFQASDGALYGDFATAPGFLFRMNTDGTGYQTIHTFAAANSNGTNVGGAYPEAVTGEGTDGDLYGVAATGGAYGGGTVFKIAKDGTGFTVLHDFNGPNPQDGATPSGNLRKGLDGTFYGMTSQGGVNNTGTIFRIDQEGNFQQIVSFPVLPASGLNAVGANPTEVIGLAQGPDGTLYGTTYAGGANGYGTLFAVMPDGSGLTDLFDFRASDFQVIGSVGDQRFQVTFGSNGLLYVTTDGGGANGTGAVLSLGPLPSHAQLLWNNVSGQAALWNIAPDGTFSSTAYGPFSGWTARAVSEAPDGADWLLWTNTNGEVSLWRVTSDGYSTVQYGPYSGFTAVSLSVASSGDPQLLWNETNGTASLWDVNKSTGAFTHTEYGPFPGWTANQVASGATVTDLLWTNTNGTAAGWRIAANGTLTTSAFGPYSGYSAVSLSVGPDDGAHLLWDSASGSESLWSADFTTGAFTATSYGPLSGWATKAIATGPDNATHLLWDNTNGEASLWGITGSGYTHTEYGPFSGWTAVAVSAGP